MNGTLINRRRAMGTLAALAAGATTVTTAKNHGGMIRLKLDDPVAALKARVKVMGSIAEERVVSFLRFHVYGQMPHEPARPLFSMNNLIVGYWRPGDDDSYHLKHYEVGYYAGFDTDDAIETWTNPYTEKEIELFPFVLGPINRQYKTDTVVAPGLAPLPLTSHVMGDRFFVATQSISRIPNIMQPDEWPERSSGENVNWSSFMTYSAPVAEVADPQRTHVGAHIQLQNFVSWQPWMFMGQRPGGLMSRAFGTHIDDFDQLPATVRAGFEKQTPDIFATDKWDIPRMDAVDYYNKSVTERQQGDDRG